MDDNEPVCGTFDPTLGGILPEFDNDFWANELGLLVPVTGEVLCKDGLACGEIFIGAFNWDWYADSLGRKSAGFLLHHRVLMKLVSKPTAKM